MYDKEIFKAVREVNDSVMSTAKEASKAMIYLIKNSYISMEDIIKRNNV